MSDSGPPPIPRARVKKPSFREERVRHCMSLMRAGEWRKGETGADLAIEWSIAKTTVDDIASEAWRRVQSEVLDAPAIQVYAVDRLRKVTELQMAAAEESDKPGLERRVAVHALSELLKYAESGVLFPAGWERLSAEDKWAAVDRAQAKIDAIRATLPARDAGQLGEGDEDSVETE